MRVSALLLMMWSATTSAVEYSTVPGAGGVPLQIAEAGPASAPGILFLHGATLSSSSWMQQLESELADRFHLVAFDLRGHGNSGKPWDPDSYLDSKLWADDIAAVIEATGLTKPVFVAWSYGGHVTMDFLRHYDASRIAGIVFVGSTGGMLPFPPPDEETAAEYARLGQLAMSPDSGDQLEAARGFVNGIVEAPIPQATIDREVAAVLAVTPYARKAMQGRKLDNSDLISRLTMPVLFIIGDADRAATPEGIAGLVKNIPGARVSLYADTGHMPFIERREKFDRELATFATDAAGKEQEHISSIEVDDETRQWRMYVPPSYEGGTYMPLVIDLHGTGSTPEAEARLTGFEELAAAEGFLVATPAAKYQRKTDGRITWNVDLHQDAPDDVQFIRTLIARIGDQFNVDPTRIYATGMSGGARMSSRLACDLSDLIAAIGPVAGVRHPETCNPSRPVPVIAFHGEADGVNHYEHQSDSPAYWRMGVEEAISGWVDNNQCLESPAEETVTPAVTRISYRGCKEEAEVVFYRSEGAGHTWPGSPSADLLAEIGLGETDRDIPATRLIWEFFERHSLQ